MHACMRSLTLALSFFSVEKKWEQKKGHFLRKMEENSSKIGFSYEIFKICQFEIVI